MNRLREHSRCAVIAALVEGTSINATCRMTGVAKHTVLKLLKDMGCACAAYHDAHVRNVRVRRGWPTFTFFVKVGTEKWGRALSKSHRASWPGAPLLALFARGGRIDGRIFGLGFLSAPAPAPCTRRKERGTQNPLRYSG